MSKGKDVLRNIVKSSGTSYVEIGEKLGVCRQNAWDFINSKQRNDIMTEKFVEIAHVLGYKVALVKEVPQGGVEVI